MSSKISSLIIFAFLLITVFHFFPRCLSARNLAESPQTNYKEDNDQSKSPVRGSSTDHDGSATNDNAPTDAVNVPPPTPIQRDIYRGNGGVQSVQNNGNGSGVITSTDSNGDQSVANTKNGYAGAAARAVNGGQSVAIIKNGNATVTTRDKNGTQAVVTRDKNGASSITINNQTVSPNGGYTNAMSPHTSP